MKFIASMLICAFWAASTQAVDIPPITPRLMKSTFRIEGTNSKGQKVFGTCFLFTRQISDNPKYGWNILVTANHVLSDIAGDEAVIFLRVKQTNGIYSKLEHSIRIRENGKPLWYRHPEVDVTAMIVNLPKTFIDQHEWLSESFLAGDDTFEERDINPGDELMCLGYPLGIESNDAGFPVLRSGHIASYPIRPSTVVKSFLYDITVYGGNSGGPVFFDYRKRRIPGDESGKSVDIVGIAGLISKDISQTVKVEGYFETSTRRDPLGLAIVIPAEFIKQAVNEVIKQKQ